MPNNKQELARFFSNTGSLILALFCASKFAEIQLGWLAYSGAVITYYLLGMRPKHLLGTLAIVTVIIGSALLVAYHAHPCILVFAPIWWILIVGVQSAFNHYSDPKIEDRDLVLNTLFSACDYLNRQKYAELIRLTFITAAGAWLMMPYFSEYLVAAGDGAWYASVLADFLAQMRAGIFPVWVGQSYLAFLGATFPLRFAPYFQHLAGFIDVITLHHFGAYALQNATILISAFGGLFSCYFCLLKIIGDRRWIAALFSFLYLSCPGVIGLIYGGDMVMSFMTLPYLPMVFLGIVQSFKSPGFGPRALIVAGLGMCWLCHSPVGMWATLVTTVTQIVRLIKDKGRGFRLDIAAAALFIVLVSYAFISVLSLGKRLELNYPNTVTSILFNVTDAFPASIEPLSTQGDKPSDWHLGYGLWVVFLCGVAGACVVRRKETTVMLSLAAALLVLVLPIPFFTQFLWWHIPSAIVIITDKWPMQRLYLSIALLTLFSCAVTLSQISSKSRWNRGLPFTVLALLCSWTAIDHHKFLARGARLAHTAATSATFLLPENLALTKNDLGKTLVSPRFFSHGVMDAEMETRLLSLDQQKLEASDIEALAPGYGPHWAGTAPAQPLNQSLAAEPYLNSGIVFTPKFRLEPAKRYLLVLDFLGRDYHGVLQLYGGTLFREYILPSSGDEASFGSGAQASHVIPLFTSSLEPVEVTMRFIPSDPRDIPAKSADFARYKLIPYNADDLPIKLEGLVPFRARVESKNPALLETPRIFIAGWEAVVNGNPTPVSMSADSLVLVPVPAGKSVVEVDYHPPFAVSFSYWFSACAWLGFAGWAIFKPRFNS